MGGGRALRTSQGCEFGLDLVSNGSCGRFWGWVAGKAGGGVSWRREGSGNFCLYEGLSEGADETPALGPMVEIE